MTISTQLPPPDNWQDFENLCCDLWRKEWGQAQRWGRSGEKQDGVDIVDTANGRAIQCKLKSQLLGKRLRVEQIRDEIQKAENFPSFRLNELIIATTSAKSVSDQQMIEEINLEQQAKRSFRVMLVTWDDIVPRIELYPEIKRRYFGERPARLETPLPQLPEHFVPRPSALDSVRAEFRKARSRVGLWGMGGCGKTVLAAAIALDEEIAGRFPDGVIWLTVGHSEPLALLGLLSRFLSGETSPPVLDEQTGKIIVRSIAAGKNFLLVLDDVWTSEQAFALDVISEGAGLIVTSRISAVVEQLGAEVIEVAGLSDAQAQLMLEQWGVTSQSIAKAVAAQCGNLPLALAMAGALARRPNRTWDDALRLLCDAKLEKLETRFPGYGHPTLLSAIHASVRDLGEYEQKSYFDLAAFGGEWVPASTLATFWNDSDLVTTFAERSLVFLDDQGRVRLHDLQADYVKIQVGNTAPLHCKFVEAMRSRVGGADFATATGENDDGYFFERLPFHLARAGMQDELRHLLFDHRWLLAKLCATGVSTLVSDYQFLDSSVGPRSVSKALRLAAPVLAGDPRQLPNQLLARLTSGDADVDRLLKGARTWGEGKTWLRPTRPGLNPAGGCFQQEFACGTAVLNLSFHGDGVLEAYCSDGLLRQWDIDNGILIGSSTYAINERGQEVLQDGLPFDPDVWAWIDKCRIVVPGGRNGGIRVWNVELGTFEGDLLEHPHWAHGVTAIAVLDDRRVVTGTVQSHIGLWDVAEREFVHHLSGHRTTILSLVRIDQERFASGSDDGVIRVWDVSAQALASDVLRHSSSVSGIIATPKGIVSTDHCRTLFWNLEGESPPQELVADVGWTRLDALDEDLVAITSSGSELQVWHLDPLRLSHEIYNTWGATVAPLNKNEFVVGIDRELHLWSKQAPVLLSRFTRLPDGRIRDMVIIGERYIAASVLDQSILVFDADSGGQVARLDDKEVAWLNAVGNFIVYCSVDGYLRAWDFLTGENLKLAQFRYGRFLPRKQQLLIVDDSGLVVFDFNSKSLAWAIPEVIYSPEYFKIDWLDDDNIVTGADDGCVRIWNLRSGKCRSTCFVGGSVTALAVSGNFIVVGDRAGNVQSYSFESKQQAEAFEASQLY